MSYYDDYPFSESFRKALEARDNLLAKQTKPPLPDEVVNDIPSGGCLAYLHAADDYFRAATAHYFAGEMATGDVLLFLGHDRLNDFNSCVSKKLHMDPWATT